MRKLNRGMALFTLLDDGLPPSGSGRVSLEPPYALPTAFAGGPNLFGQSAELQVERFRGRQHRRQKAMTVFPSAPGLPFSPGTSSSLIRVIGGAMMRPLTTASASRSSTPPERRTS